MYPSTRSRGANTLKLVEIRKGRGLLFSKWYFVENCFCSLILFCSCSEIVRR
ncbi:hypothetical protein RHGRI_000555 [Rhododendron griersonianum]|uniref:Photosystem II protein N n=1 Tax=Rhododendron griersonianum TaxID=479676 RepID=A0AAV6LH24_9ERIC|nr:hypothetical protein RHGRI_000555 [Rhododendron griersonianum]KAG5564400.1 hypothetical protein RHGRI_000555 [Rhododendron griersonianum]